MQMETSLSFIIKNFLKLLGKKTINLERSNYLLVRQDPPFNMNYITTTYFLDRLKTVKIINNPTSIRNVSENYTLMNLKNICHQQFLPQEFQILLVL